MPLVMKTKTNKKRIVLLDTHAIIHRAYHALPELTGPGGAPTGALYGLVSMLLKIITDLKPDYIAASLDTPEPTFRDKEYADYKAHRAPTSDELIPQLKKAPAVYEVFGVRSFAIPGFEADDLIGSFVEMFKDEPDLKIVILSGDRDVLQLVEGEKVVGQLFKTGITETVI